MIGVPHPVILEGEKLLQRVSDKGVLRNDRDCGGYAFSIAETVKKMLGAEAPGLKFIRISS